MMVELILLALLILIGALWFKKLSYNPEKEVKELEYFLATLLKSILN